MILNKRRTVKRNEKCPFCTSGKKFKKCHGAPQPQGDGVLGAARYAGHPQERPTLYAYTPVCALGPMPAEQVALV